MPSKYGKRNITPVLFLFFVYTTTIFLLKITISIIFWKSNNCTEKIFTVISLLPLHKNFAWIAKVYFVILKHILWLSSWHSKWQLIFRDLKLTDQISCLNKFYSQENRSITAYDISIPIISDYEAKQTIGGGDGQQKRIIIWKKWKYNNSFWKKRTIFSWAYLFEKVFYIREGLVQKE